MKKSALLVVPSLWPEPFGLVGLEAGLLGLPAAAFAVGGIPEWLSNGVNGFLAPGDPPTAAGLAQAIANCLQDANQYARLRQGAQMMAQRYTMKAHLDKLIEIFAAVVGK
jgi:glycosyltransferase involved in cell wall biosynthesis